MKKIFATFAFIIASTICFSQSYSTRVCPFGGYENTALGIGYSYSIKHTHEIWFSTFMFEWSIFFNGTDKEYLPDTMSPYNNVRWTEREIGGFEGGKFGYIINDYLSVGLSLSWRRYEHYYENGYCSLHHENHEWINGRSTEAIDTNIGIYAKASIPLWNGLVGGISLFAVGQVALNGNNLLGLGILFRI